MTDEFRYAANWDDTIVNRHNGKIIGQLHYKPGSGDVTILREFDNLSAKERCDVLKNVLLFLEREYTDAMNDFYVNYRRQL